MTEPERGPERLFAPDDPLLAAAREDAPPPGLEARILAGIGGGGGGGAAPPATSTGGSASASVGGAASLGWKLALAGAVGVGVVVWLLRAPGADPAPTTGAVDVPRPAISAATPSPSSGSPEREVAIAAPPPSGPLEASSAVPVAVTAPSGATLVPSSVALASARPHPSAAPSAALGLGAEIKALDGARAAMNAGAPESALRELDAYDRAFPQGALKQEASLLRIDALMRAGRTAEARSLGHALLAEHPSTPHRKRILTLLREAE